MGKIEAYAPHLEGKVLTDLLRFARNANFKKGYRGGTAMYLPYNNNYGVLYSNIFLENNISPEAFKETIDEVWRVFQSGAKVAPVVGFARDSENKGIYNPHHKDKLGRYRDFVFVKNAPGLRLNDTQGYKSLVHKIIERLEGPEVHYDDIVKTFIQVVKESKIRPDISSRNTLHHPIAGLNFVDFNKCEEQKPTDHVQHHTTDFLKSFMFLNSTTSGTKNYFRNQEEQEHYYNIACKEQQLLVSKLHKGGISEEVLEHGIKQVPELKSPTIDALFGR